MKIDIYLLDSLTGERQVYQDQRGEWLGWEDSDDPSPGYQISFMFGDGNYACDCNRQLFFEAAKTGKWPVNIMEPSCGDGRFVIEKIVDRETGLTVYQDG